MKIPQRILEAAEKRLLIPFIGAGFSKQVSSDDFPTWSDLLTELGYEAIQAGYIKRAEYLELKKLIKEGKHLLVAEELKTRLPRDFYLSSLQKRYSRSFKSETSEAHKQLISLNPRMLITTNYDHLIEDSYASIIGRNLTVMKYTEADYVQRRLQEHSDSRPFLFKIHGDIEDAANIVLSETDYRRLLYDSHGYKSILSSLFLHYVVVFIGFALNDPELVQTLQQIRHALKEGNQPDYALCESGSFSEIEARRFRNDFGVEILSYPAGKNHEGIVKFLRMLNRSLSK